MGTVHVLTIAKSIYPFYMYSKQQAATIKTAFWTSLGQYMKPVPSAWKEKVNWLNYKTGVKDVYFRLQADEKKATVSIDINIPDAIIRTIVFEQFYMMKSMLEGETNEPWIWQANACNEVGQPYAKIYTELLNVHVLKQDDWPAIIGFFKPRMIALDAFWANAKEGIEMAL